MAIIITEIQGTDSVKGSRITINDNFETIVDSLNKVLSVFDTATGTFDNSSYGSGNNIITESIEVSSGSITINTGDIVISSGDINLNGANAAIEFGTNAGINVVQTGYTSGGNAQFLNFDNLNCVGVIVPQLAATGLTGYAGLTAVTTGTLLYDSTNGKLVVWTGSAWETITSS